MNLIAVVVAAEEHQLAELWLPAYWFAIIPAVILALMGFVTFSFRDVANRHRARTQDSANEARHH